MIYPDVQIVDEEDKVVGHMPLPRAFEEKHITRVAKIFITNLAGQILIQKRSEHVTGPGLWDLSCSGLVEASDENYETTAFRELKEELGIPGVELNEIMTFFNIDKFEETEIRRFNKVFVAEYSGAQILDTSQVEQTIWMYENQIDDWYQESPDEFTHSFSEAWKAYKNYTKQQRMKHMKL